MLKIVDSIEIKSTLPSPVFLSDIRYINTDQHFVIVFFGKIDSLQNQYEIINNGKSIVYNISSKIEVAEKCGFFPIENGYFLPKYWGDRLIYFDKSRRQAISVLKNKAPRGFNTGANKDLYGMADGYANDSMLLLNCYKPRKINYKWKESKLLKALQVYYCDPFLFWINLNDNSIQRPFGSYPKELSGNVNSFRANMLHYFCVDDQDKKIYVSFGGSSLIQVYSFGGEIIESFRVPGYEVDSTLLFHNQCSKSILRFPDYHRLSLDTYAEVIYSGSSLFRTYRKALEYDAFRQFEPVQEFDICLSPKMEENWNISERSKRKYLQQIDPISHKSSEFSYPEQMDIFLGYNRNKKEYYFRKWTPPTLTDSAKIYVYKVPEIIPENK